MFIVNYFLKLPNHILRHFYIDLEATSFYVCRKDFRNHCPDDVFDPSAYCRAVKAYWWQSFGVILRYLRLGEAVLASRGFCSLEWVCPWSSGLQLLVVRYIFTAVKASYLSSSANHGSRLRWLDSLTFLSRVPPGNETLSQLISVGTPKLLWKL